VAGRAVGEEDYSHGNYNYPKVTPQKDRKRTGYLDREKGSLLKLRDEAREGGSSVTSQRKHGKRYLVSYIVRARET